MGIRDLKYDYIRALAIVFVICIHSTGTLNNSADAVGTLSFAVSKVLSATIITGVPLFVMLSGALLLGKDEPLEVFFKKRMKRVLIPFVAWSIIVFALSYFINHSIELSFTEFIIMLTTSGVHGIYWYVYMLFGLYLLTPVLRAFLRNANEKLSLYFVTILLVTILFDKCLPDIKLFSRFHSENLLYLFYFIAGYVINKYIATKHRFHTIIIVGFILSFLLCLTDNIYQITNFPFIIFVGLFLFCLMCMKNKNEQQQVRIGKITLGVKFVSEVSYGIYLSHFLFISFFCHLGIEHAVPLFIEPFVMVALVLISECILMFMIKKIKLDKYLM